MRGGFQALPMRSPMAWSMLVKSLRLNFTQSTWVFLKDGSVLGRCRAVYGGGKITNDISIDHDFASRDSDLVSAGHRSLVRVAQDTRFVVLAERHT